MCKWGTYAKVELCEIDGIGKEEPIDSCIAPIVQALNDSKIKTVVSCCGHGRPLGDIYLQDGRILLIDNCGDWKNHRYRLLIKALWVHFIYPKRVRLRTAYRNLLWRIKNLRWKPKEIKEEKVNI